MCSLLPSVRLSQHPVDVGQRSEAAVIGELVKRGYRVLLPFGVNHRYDLVIDVQGRFLRAQCKTGRLRHGSVVFHSSSIRSNTREAVIRSYRGEVDLFLVYCPDTDEVYVVDVAEVGTSEVRLRIEPTRNGQDARIRWAAEHVLSSQEPERGLEPLTT
jgi:PD-(D/E)XK endonuclease